MKYKRIRFNEWAAFLEKNPELKPEVHPNFSSSILRVPTGEVFVVTWDGAVLFDSFAEALRVMGKPLSLGIENLIPDPYWFIENTQVLCEDFCREYADCSCAVLLEKIRNNDFFGIDSVVKNNPKSFLESTKFQQLVACVGEAYRIEKHGEWRVEARKDMEGDKVRIPMIETPSGYIADIPRSIRKQLVEWEGYRSIGAAYYSESGYLDSYIRRNKTRFD